MASISKRVYKATSASGQKVQRTKYRARYRDLEGREYEREFPKRKDAQDWLDDATTKIRTGTHTDPKHAKMTVATWCDTWIEGYRVNRDSTVRQAEMHLSKIKAHFGPRRLSSITPTQVKNWTAKLQQDGLSASYIYALHGRLSQLYSDAIHDGIVAKSPCSRKTSPPQGEQVQYVAVTSQVWALHDAMPKHLRGTILLGAFAGLRAAEVCGTAVDDIDFMAGSVAPVRQYPDLPLKSKMSKTIVPFPRAMALELSAHVSTSGVTGWLFVNEWGDQLAPRTLERAFKRARATVIASEMEAGLPVRDRLNENFRFHDLRHYFASHLIASGMDIKTVQRRMRHASAKTTLDVYGHLFPDRDESTRDAVGLAFAERRESRGSGGLHAI